MKALAKATIAVGAIAMATPSWAQQEPLTENSVRSFFQDTTKQAEQAVQEGDWQGVLDWAQRHLADGATIAFKGAVVSKNGSVISYAATFNSNDLLGADAMMAPQHLVASLGRVLQDYSLDTTVLSVSMLPNGDASAIVRFQETASMDLSETDLSESGLSDPAESDEQVDQQPTTEGRSPSIRSQDSSSKPVIQSMSMCNFRLSKGGEDGMQIDIAACDTTTTL